MIPYAALNHACLDKQVIYWQQFTIWTEESTGKEKQTNKPITTTTKQKKNPPPPKKQSTKATNKKEKACSEIQASFNKLFASNDDFTCFYFQFMTSYF